MEITIEDEITKNQVLIRQIKTVQRALGNGTDSLMNLGIC